jgi:hypothetical protein
MRCLFVVREHKERRVLRVTTRFSRYFNLSNPLSFEVYEDGTAPRVGERYLRTSTSPKTLR